ncbi:hypothetical protein [Corynebacterium propinquum]|uniref:hypothetical protein n=1 Tax=Corynebacterium propinquum TaxID=43769 RepID=UPI002541226D|nr:hypothetical protein [Corynebacterium propinquum]MDK4258341.1 hypothetical protein [Corynebacterium propinquum]MDK4293249.1 hypothetical protein [Corynebacterium propinquum]MDK4299072.1 hypothetical protein [Corynebacterium propinquum]
MESANSSERLARLCRWAGGHIEYPVNEGGGYAVGGSVATLSSPTGCHGHRFTPVIMRLVRFLQIGPLKVAFFVHYL